MRLLVVTVVAFLIFSVVEGRPNRLSLKLRGWPLDPDWSVDNFIIGGQIATLGQWPSQLSLEYLGVNGWAHICGAVLIKERYALTAAHCVMGVGVQSLRLWGGVVDRSNIPGGSGIQLLPVAHYIMHQNFTPSTPGVPNNIAIISLTVPADTTGPNVKSAVIPQDDDNNFNHGGCFATGFGRDADAPNMSQYLKWIQMPGITNTDCKDRVALIDYADVFPEHLCVLSDPPTTGPCNGDGGGPLYCYPTENDPSVTFLAGVGSWNIALNDGCNPLYPAAFTRISKYLQWLIDNAP